MTPSIQATNVFFYYSDLEKALAFYRDVLGFSVAADYGFAKIMQITASSFVTLVDVEQGMHSMDEPKTVALAIVTAQVEAWYHYLMSRNILIQEPFDLKDNQPHDGFVILDPEGYFLEFERFNPHIENVELIPLLESGGQAFGRAGTRPSNLGIQATVLWLYYQDLASSQEFYETLLGVDLLVDQGWAKIYPVAPTGYIGLVTGEKALHQPSPTKAVTVSFVTNDIAAWFKRASLHPDFKLRNHQVEEKYQKVKTFVGYDLENTFLEWDEFLGGSENRNLLNIGQ